MVITGGPNPGLSHKAARGGRRHQHRAEQTSNLSESHELRRQGWVMLERHVQEQSTAKLAANVLNMAEEHGVPCLLWCSIPCAGGPCWQRVNLAKHGETAKIPPTLGGNAVAVHDS